MCRLLLLAVVFCSGPCLAMAAAGATGNGLASARGAPTTKAGEDAEPVESGTEEVHCKGTGGFWLPNIRLWPHSKAYLADYMQRLKDRRFNCPKAIKGITAMQPPIAAEPLASAPPGGYRINHRRTRLGKGEDCYRRAVQALQTGDVVNLLGWARLLFQETDHTRWSTHKEAAAAAAAGVGGGVPTSVVTHVKCLCFWIANPCRLVNAQWDARAPRDGPVPMTYSSLAFCTLEGHMLAGEERFSVEWHDSDDSVVLDMFSVAKGAGPLGALILPLCRPLQKAFFRGVEAAMQRLLGAGDVPV